MDWRLVDPRAHVVKSAAALNRFGAAQFGAAQTHDACTKRILWDPVIRGAEAVAREFPPNFPSFYLQVSAQTMLSYISVHPPMCSRSTLAAAASFAATVFACSADPTTFDREADASPTEEADGGSADAALDVATGETSPPPPDANSDAPPGKVSILAAMNAALATVGSEQKTRSPSSNIALAITDLSTRDHVSIAGNVEHVSASSPKMIWVASVLKRAGIAAVSPYAPAIFELSDNDATGKAIDLLASYNLLNEDYQAWGMPNSAFTQWSFGKTRQASNSPMKLGTNNYFTADDATKFLENLHDGKVLPPTETTKLLEWAKTSPRKGYGGWLGTKLPANVQATMVHKAGWIPPPSNSRCTNEIGIVSPANGRSYAVAIFARFVDDADYNTKQLPFVEYASCVIYRTMAEDPGYVCN